MALPSLVVLYLFPPLAYWHSFLLEAEIYIMDINRKSLNWYCKFFFGQTDMVSITAEESSNPGKAVPKYEPLHFMN
jgi:amino acid permease